MGKKDSKKTPAPAIETEPSVPAVVDETPWWEADFRSQPLELEGLSSRVYLVLEAADRDADLMAMLVSGVRSGVRRRFTLLERDEALKLVPDAKKLAPDPNAKGGRKTSKREQSPSRTPVGVPVEQGMLTAAAEKLRDAGQLDAVAMAMVVKHALSLLLAERRAAAGTADVLPMPASAEPPKPGKGKKKEAPVKKKKPAGKPEKPAAADEEVKDKSDEKEDKEFEAFCEARQSSLQKRGEAQEPAYKDDEPADGPDLYILLVGFSEPRLPLELAACGVHAEAVLRLGGEPCHLESASLRSTATTRSGRRSGAADRAAQFWRELPACLAPDVGRLQDTALAEVVVDRCRVQFAPDAPRAADQVYTAVAREMYRYLRLRTLFEKYAQSVAAVPVPDAPKPPPPPPEPTAEPPGSPDPLPQPEPEPETEPCLQEPVEYRRLLAPLPPETVTVPLLVNALVEQVCAWAVPAWRRQDQPPDEAAAGEPCKGTRWNEDENGTGLKEEFPPLADDTDRGPVLVYEGDAVNAAFCDWADRDAVLSAEHVLTQAPELQALLRRPPAPDAGLWRHQAARQEIQTAEGGPGSGEAADLMLRQLVFESMYAVLTPDGGGGGGGPRPYPHPFLPAQSVLPDAQWLAPECGDAALAPDAASLDNRDVLLAPAPRFAEYRVCERLDRLTMAQTLEEARDGRRRLAAYHFGGDDGLYLMYGHPRVRRGRLQDVWQRRTHTAVGLRDFVEHVQHWPEVRAWLHRQYGEILEASVPPPPPTPPRPASATTGESRGESRDGSETADGRPPESGVQLPDVVFLVPGSLKHEASLQQQRGEEKPARESLAPAPAAKPEKKRKESGRRGSQSPRKGSTKPGRGEEAGSPPPPPAISVVQFEIRPKTPDAGARHERPPSPVPPEKVFAGYSLALDRLLHVSGSRQRQYLSDGSHVTVRRSEYVHGPAALVVSVRQGETRLTLHPGVEEHELVGVLAGGVVLHPRPALRERPPLPQETPAPPSSAMEEVPSPPQSRKSVRHRSPPEKSKKKEPKKEKKVEQKLSKRVGGKKRQQSVGEEPPPPPVLEEPAPPTEEPAEPPLADRRVQTLRLSCPSGLVVELEPDPFWPGPEPRVRVVQYYVGAACERRCMRVHLSDGTLLLLHGDDQPEDEVLMLDIDGGLTTYARTEAGLVPVRAVTAAGRRVSHAAAAPPEPRPLLSKMATDPVTRELYVQREDGARAVIRPGGQSVLQLPDGTRVTMTAQEEPPPAAEPRPPGCSDYLVNEDGWIGAPCVSWLLGARVTIDDAAAARRAVTIEHPRYARVVMDQRRERCQVRLPQGLLIEADSGGFFYLSQPDGSRLQIDDRLLCFSSPGAEGVRPVVHTLRLGPPGEPPPAEPPASVTFADGAATAAGAPAEPAEVAQGEATAPFEAAAGSEVAAPASTAADAAAAATAAPVVAAAATSDAAAPSEAAGETAAAQRDAAPPLYSLCETVDSDGSVWRVTPDGQLVPVGPQPEPLPEPLPLELRRQLDQETVMPEPPRLFVLYRQGDGLQLLPSSEAEAYLECVQRTPGAVVVCEPHQGDAELSVVKAFRPVGGTLADRWRVPYAEPNIVPPNLRCRDLQLLCRGSPPPEAGAEIWGRGEPVSAAPPPPPRLPAGLVCTRELIVAPPLAEDRRDALMRAVHEVRLRHRADPAAAQLLPTEAPPVTRVQHVYEPDRLLHRLAAAAAASRTPSAPLRPHRESRASSARGADIRELDKILIYRDMLRRRRFPRYFLTADGCQFLATLRQTPGDGRPALVRRRLQEAPLRLAAAPGDAPPGTGDVTCRPARLDLGLVRPDGAACAELRLYSGADAELTFRVTPPAPPLGLRVRPVRGVLPPRGDAVLRVQFAPCSELRSRSVYCLLEVVVDEEQRLHVPVAACVAGGGVAEVLREDTRSA